MEIETLILSKISQIRKCFTCGVEQFEQQQILHQKP
jgi:hypothetical protein